MRKTETDEIILEPENIYRLSMLCGPGDENLLQIEKRLGVAIEYDGGSFKITGYPGDIKAAEHVLNELYTDTAPIRGKIGEIAPEDVHLAIQSAGALEKDDADDEFGRDTTIKTKKGNIKPRSHNQAQYVSDITSHDVTFGIGPAGSGKTYLAVAAAVDALERQEVRRIILTRPAVEAGEKLGFLPGDLAQKIDPYLRPLYDALFEMLGFERVDKLLERQVIEIAPLAYMRGRTLNDAFIILDESQNTTIEQMKMFLTRIGFNSRAVITGDITQIDLPRHIKSGLKHAIEVLTGVEGLAFDYFTSTDIVRHPVVARIVKAYDSYDKKVEREASEKAAAAKAGAGAAAVQVPGPFSADTGRETD